MAALITGGAGYIGSHMAFALLDSPAAPRGRALQRRDSYRPVAAEPSPAP